MGGDAGRDNSPDQYSFWKTSLSQIMNLFITVSSLLRVKAGVFFMMFRVGTRQHPRCLEALLSWEVSKNGFQPDIFEAHFGTFESFMIIVADPVGLNLALLATGAVLDLIQTMPAFR